MLQDVQTIQTFEKNLNKSNVWKQVKCQIEHEFEGNQVYFIQVHQLILMICDFNSYIPRERTLGLKFLKGLKDFRWVRKLYGAILLWGCPIDWRTGSPLLSPLEAYLFQTHCRLSLSTHEKMPTAQATIFSRADLWVLRGTYPFLCEILYYFLKVLYKICSIYIIAGPCYSNIW